MSWQPMDTAPKDRVLRLYAPDLVDDNTGGSVEGFWRDDEGWIGAVWSECHDEWVAKTITPTHWQPLPEPPL